MIQNFKLYFTGNMRLNAVRQNMFKLECGNVKNQNMSKLKKTEKSIFLTK